VDHLASACMGERFCPPRLLKRYAEKTTKDRHEMRVKFALILSALFVASLTESLGSVTKADIAQAVKRTDAKSSCTAHVVKTTSASGEVSMKLICDGGCANEKPCEERWLSTYDWKNHKKLLTRTCYCDEEIRMPPCCTDEDSTLGVAYLKGKCRVALLYPPRADVGPNGEQSKNPTKDPIDVVCVSDRPVEMTCVCKLVTKTMTQDGVKVELISCKCFH
jgi:hypothetical protein